jgi:hypothetical protein
MSDYTTTGPVNILAAFRITATKSDGSTVSFEFPRPALEGQTKFILRHAALNRTQAGELSFPGYGSIYTHAFEQGKGAEFVHNFTLVGANRQQDFEAHLKPIDCENPDVKLLSRNDSEDLTTPSAAHPIYFANLAKKPYPMGGEAHGDWTIENTSTVNGPIESIEDLPTEPAGLSGSESGGDVTLNWTWDTTEWTTRAGGRIEYYNVLRGTSDGGPYTPINSTNVTTATYTDTAPGSGTYYYIVEAVDEAGFATQVDPANDEMVVVP